ncbi:MAG: hypothetical protein UMU75_07530 [Halomonas sp.]|nr:hypothetical protein [Halomonas sp.]
MTHTARVEPIKEDRGEHYLVTGWRVVDVSNPAGPREVSRHESEPEAIEAARLFERKTSYEPGSDPDDNQDYDASVPSEPGIRE